jgi:hypothetical protein
MSIEALGVTVMPEWFACEGIEPVLDRLQQLGATALATSPYVMEQGTPDDGGREPPADGDAGKVRPLDRELWGQRELWVRTAPSLVHDRARYAGLRYQPLPPTPLTFAQHDLLDRVCAAAAVRGIAVYLQVMAASPPGYRVQFAGVDAEDQCLGPDGLVHRDRVDRNASLASPHVTAYTAALVTELAMRYPLVAGIRLDWPEYPPYDMKSALFDFNPAMLALLQQRGADPAAVRAAVTAWADGVRAAAAGAAARGPAAVRDALLAAEWNALTAAQGPLAPLFAAKKAAARALLAQCRAALDTVPGPRRRFEPQFFPPPFQHMSGGPLDALDGIADAIGIKLYTMHWPMLARYWARDLVGAAAPAQLDAVTAAVASLFGLTDGLDPDGRRLRYPEPHEPHPVGARAQHDKLVEARALAGAVPVRAFAHSYGPLADVVARYRIAAQSGGPRWINRYGYLSDAKIAALAR